MKPDPTDGTSFTDGLSFLQTAHITSKHGRITSAALDYTPPLVSDEIHDIAEELSSQLAESLVGDKYGSLDGMNQPEDTQARGMQHDIVQWLRKEM